MVFNFTLQLQSLVFLRFFLKILVNVFLAHERGRSAQHTVLYCNFFINFAQAGMTLIQKRDGQGAPIDLLDV